MAPNPPVTAARVKPLLRGVSHQIAAAIATPAVFLLAAGTTGVARTAATVYGASLVTLLLVSTCYHRPVWSLRARTLIGRLDHAAIFVLIAGTYTPFCLLMGDGTGTTLLAAAWGFAAAGILMTVFWDEAPKPLRAAVYVAFGWMIVPVLSDVYAAVGPRPFALLLAGGALYTTGAVIYALRRPDPVPHVFGFHEIFHLFVVAAAACHFAAVAGVVRLLAA
jgi:hemolysin III